MAELALRWILMFPGGDDCHSGRAKRVAGREQCALRLAGPALGRDDGSRA